MCSPIAYKVCGTMSFRNYSSIFEFRKSIDGGGVIYGATRLVYAGPLTDFSLAATALVVFGNRSREPTVH